MELLLTKNPFLSTTSYKSVQDYFIKLVNEANEFNIATGYITNDSIATLKQIIDVKGDDMKVNLFIGMNYLEGFTRIQYNAIKDLSTCLKDTNRGNIYLSTRALYHGKMYAFLKDGQCIGSFIGSSNLGSFVGNNPNYVESDAYFSSTEGNCINNQINTIINKFGTEMSNLIPLTKFRDPEKRLLKGYHHVKEVENEDIEKIKNSITSTSADIKLKTETKSNLNAYFGAGKIKNKYSPRGWYEVELIIGKNTPANAIIPKNGPFTVITEDGYQFKCERQGDNNKNFRSVHDLKILGRWIKGKMENEGALEIGKTVTTEVLSTFGHNTIRLTKTSQLDESDSNIWYLQIV